MAERKNILLLTNSEYGQANVMLAVVHELVLQCEFDIHIASFPVLEQRINDVYATLTSKMVSSLTFHALPGQSLIEAIASNGHDFGTGHRPVARGSIKSYDAIQDIVAPWDGPEYLKGYDRCLKLFETLDPVVVVVDPLYSQGLDACRRTSRRHIVLSPVSLKEITTSTQSRLAFLWKYPAVASGLPYPLPWYQTLLNIYLNIRLIISLLTSSRLKELGSYRKKHSITGTFPCLEPYQPQAQYICPALPEIDFPFVIPKNVTTAGPILLPAKPVSEGDPELAAWLHRKPTILVNLGTHARLGVEDARELASGLRMVLARQPKLQVLWKLKSKGPLDDQISSILNKELASDTVRIKSWLAADPSAILQSGSIVCYVNHSGGNAFYEATGTGIPQVALPMWYDCYDFASRVEYLGIGLRANHRDAPHVDAEEFGVALGTVVDEKSEKGRAIRERATALGEVCRKAGGRVTACERIVQLARRWE